MSIITCRLAYTFQLCKKIRSFAAYQMVYMYKITSDVNDE